MSEVKHTEDNSKYWRALVFSVVFTLFLFWLDEGYYDFRWMNRAANWYVFIAYVVIIYGLYLFVSWVRSRHKRKKGHSQEN